MIVATAAMCLALNLYHEARGESIMGQYGVAMVTLNRAHQDKSRVCQEVFRAKQFSWANHGVKKVAGGWQLTARMNPTDAYAWVLAQRIAKVSLSGRMVDFTHGSTHYHANYVRPRWRLAMAHTKTIGRHLFYSAVRQS